MQRIILVCPLFLMLAGCDELGSLSEPTRYLVLEVQEESDALVAEQVLRNRFEDRKRPFVSSIKSQINGRKITFEFRHGAPGLGVAESLVGRKGGLVFRSQGEDLIISADNIDDVKVQPEEGYQKRSLIFLFSEDFGQKLSDFSDRHKEKDVEMLVGGTSLVVAKNYGFSRSVVVNMHDYPIKILMEIASTIKSGELPPGVVIVSNTLE